MEITSCNMIDLNECTEKNAVVLYIEDTDGNVLLVTRKSGGHGLPGGKVDEGETLVDACIREVKEETNMDIEDIDLILKPLYAQFIEGFWCTCFILVRLNGEPVQVITKENIEQREEGVIPEFLSNDYFINHSAYCDYNTGVYNSFKEYKKIYESLPDDYNILEILK